MAVRFGFKFFRGLVHMRAVNDNTVPLHSLLGSDEDGNGICKSINGPANKIAYIDMIYDKDVIEKPYLEADTIEKFVAGDYDEFISGDISNKLTDNISTEASTFFRVNENNTDDILKNNIDIYNNSINKEISRKNEILNSRDKRKAIINKSYQYRYSKIKQNCVCKQKYSRIFRRMQTRSINCSRCISNQKNMLACTLSKMSNSKNENDLLNKIFQQVIVVEKPTKEYFRNKNSLENCKNRCKITRSTIPLSPSLATNYFYTGNVLSQKLSTQKHNSCDNKGRMISTASALKYKFSKSSLTFKPFLKRFALFEQRQPAVEKTSCNNFKEIDKHLKELQGKNDSFTKVKRFQKKRKPILDTVQPNKIQANFKPSSEFEFSYSKAMEDVTKLRKNLFSRYKNEHVERKQLPRSSNTSICRTKRHTTSNSNISHKKALQFIWTELDNNQKKESNDKDNNTNKESDDRKEVKLNSKTSESKDNKNLEVKSVEDAEIKVRSLNNVANKSQPKKDNNFENLNKIKVKNITEKEVTKTINSKLNEEKFTTLKLYIEKLKHAKTTEKNI